MNGQNKMNAFKVIITLIACILLCGISYVFFNANKILKNEEIKHIDSSKNNLKLIWSYDLSSGHIYKYDIDKDTIFVVEGKLNKNSKDTIFVLEEKSDK